MAAPVQTRTFALFIVPWVVVALSAVSMVAGLWLKTRCGGAPFDDIGRSADYSKISTRYCYTDIQYLWSGREIDNHVFPYLHGSITPDGRLLGGAVEYPVLSGLLLWVGAIGAHTDLAFLVHTGALLIPFGLATAYLLGRLAGRRALLWALTPPLLVYGAHNLELPVVLTTVGAIAVMVWARDTGCSEPAAAIWAAAIIAVGVNLKLYPGLFLLPLALYILLLPPRGRDLRGALAVLGAGIGFSALINVPFMLLGWEGWRGSIKFQQLRKPDLSTNSIWYYGLRHLYPTDPAGTDRYIEITGKLSPLCVVLGIALALALGARHYRRTGTFPWIGVCGAILCAFMLFHKVHSPQYALWLLPFFILLRVPWSVVGAYLVCDLSLSLTLWPAFGDLASGDPHAWYVSWGLYLGIWGRAALLLVLIAILPGRESLSGWTPTGLPRNVFRSIGDVPTPQSSGTPPADNTR